MKMIYIIAACILGIVLFYMKSTDKSLTDTKSQIEPKNKTIKTKENTFPDLRKMAFSTNPEQLGLTLSEKETIVYGIIMDWEMGGAVATTVAYQTGDASLYLSSGGGVIGGGQHKNVSDAAKEFVGVGQKYIKQATKTETQTLPNNSQVKFYFLTNKGLYCITEEMKNFENNSSSFTNLFEEGNKVLSELRIISEK